MTDSSSPAMSKSGLLTIVPVMFCFFAMGFVDLVGTASNYVAQDLHLTQTEAGFLPSLVFFWFLLFAVPTGILMNRIGRKRTVLISLVITGVSLVIPIFGNSYAVMLVAFSLLGIGNAVMQTSLNPLVSNLIHPDKLASTLTFGQFVKAIASFLATIIIPWGAVTAGFTFGLGWRFIFVIYAAVSFLSIVILGATPIKEAKPDKASGLLESVKLLGRPFILLCFIGIACHVGIDVGTNKFAPTLLVERLGMTLEAATFATTIYFIMRTIGCFTGSFILRYVPAKLFFALSVALMVGAVVILFTCDSLTALYIGVGMIGYGNSNIFSVIFAQALNHTPNEKNEVSGLMIMGLFGGTVFPFAMGYAADIESVGHNGAIAVMSIAVLYLAVYTLCIKKEPGK